MQPVTRRSFLLTLGGGSIGLFVAACAPAAPTAGPTQPPKPAATAPAALPTEAPKPAAAVTAAPKPTVQKLILGSGPPTVETNNSPVELSAFVDFQLRPMYESLIGQDPTSGKRVPELAESWNVEPDGKSYRFRLRRGVQFHNSFGEFTARDVQAWYEAVIGGPPTAGAGP